MPKVRKLVDIEREELSKALRVTKGNTGIAADLLGVSRKTIYKMMRRHRIGQIRKYQRKEEEAQAS